jgi:hypothetical protein
MFQHIKLNYPIKKPFQSQLTLERLNKSHAIKPTTHSHASHTPLDLQAIHLQQATLDQK